MSNDNSIELDKSLDLDKGPHLNKTEVLDKSLDLDYKRGDVLLAMVVCSLFLRDVPMGFREKVILCVIIMKFIDVYVKTQADIIWVDQQLKKMEGWDSNVALRGTDSIERDWTSDDKVLEDDGS